MVGRAQTGLEQTGFQRGGGGGIVEETCPFQKGTASDSCATVGIYHALFLTFRESSWTLGAARRGVAHALQRRHPLAAGKHLYARKASTASATGGHLSRSTPWSTQHSNAAKETVTAIRRYAVPNARPLKCVKL